jgi:transposase-like protein
MSTSKNTDHATIDYATTPVKKLRNAHDRSTEVTLEQWAAEHDVFGWLLPLRHRNHNPIKVALSVADQLAAYPDTAKTFTRKTMDVGDPAKDIALPILRLHHATPLEVTNRRMRYLNPSYTHYTHEIDVIDTQEDRLSFYNKYAPLGTVTRSWLATHFGISTTELTQFIERQTGRTPKEDITTGKRRLARTIATIRAWTDRTLSDLAHAIGTPQSTLYDWRKQWIDGSEWKPPQRPVGKSWFAPTYSVPPSEIDEITDKTEF